MYIKKVWTCENAIKVNITIFTFETYENNYNAVKKLIDSSGNIFLRKHVGIKKNQCIHREIDVKKN